MLLRRAYACVAIAIEIESEGGSYRDIAIERKGGKTNFYIGKQGAFAC